MALIGPLHPLLIHFPIALVVVALMAEIAAIATDDTRWRVVAVANVRVAAGFALLAVLAGWKLATALGIDSGSLLEWHRWLGAVGAGVTVIAALATLRLRRRSAIEMWIYRPALFCATSFIVVAGHFGGLLVWGADFLRP
jgi:uncharacterized membrane protein